MGLFKNLRQNARMAKYLRAYDTLPEGIKLFYLEEEFTEEVSRVWELQQMYEGSIIPANWPLNCIDEFSGWPEHLEWVKSEGGTEEDFIWWEQLAPLEKILLKASDYGARRAVMFDLNQKTNMEPTAIMKEVHKHFTVYSEDKPDLSSMTPRDREYYSGQDRPLPFELHNRIDKYLMQNVSTDSLAAMKKEMEQFSSANMWVRHLIKAHVI